MYIRRMIRWCTRRTILWSSEELVREVCPHGFLRLHSPDDPVWVQGMRRTIRRMQVSFRSLWSKVATFFGWSGDDAGRCLGRTIGPFGDWGHLTASAKGRTA